MLLFLLLLTGLNVNKRHKLKSKYNNDNNLKYFLYVIIL